MTTKTGMLNAADYNPRTITDERLRMLSSSMKEFGDLSGIVKNIRTGNLVGGHQRVKVFDPDWPIIPSEHHDDSGTVAMGYIETPYGRWSYREVDWDENREKMANIAANKHGGEFDLPKLAGVLEEIELQDHEEEIRPYKKTHVLLSFSPEVLASIKDHLEAIIATKGVEYEQGSN